MRRIEQAGAVPVTAMQVLLEFQRDWARKEHYDEVMSIVKEHGGAYGQGVEYAYTIVHGAPASDNHAPTPHSGSRHERPESIRHQGAMHRTLRSYVAVADLCFSRLFTAAARAADFGPDSRRRGRRRWRGEYHCRCSGPPVILIHATRNVARGSPGEGAASRFTVIAPDLPGIGDSSIPKTGIDMKTSAERIHAAVRLLGYSKARVVGHDIGLMVAYAYAAMYPQEVEKLALMDAFLPGVGGWEAVYNNPGIWHFRFYGATPEALVKGRERIYFEHLNDLLPTNALDPGGRSRAYTQAYSRPGGWLALRISRSRPWCRVGEDPTCHSCPVDRRSQSQWCCA
jgi:pimeloyl-ACP methyl ester carboxylesterase